MGALTWTAPFAATLAILTLAWAACSGAPSKVGVGEPCNTDSDRLCGLCDLSGVCAGSDVACASDIDCCGEICEVALAFCFVPGGAGGAGGQGGIGGAEAGGAGGQGGSAGAGTGGAGGHGGTGGA
jgi:hypothetical protein